MLASVRHFNTEGVEQIMRILGIYAAFAIAALVAVGCTGGTATTAASAFTPVANAANVRPADDENHQKYQLIVPLQFDGVHFSIAPFASCGNFHPGDAPNYTALSSGQLTFTVKLAFTPTCAPSPMPAQLSIVGAEVKPDGNSGRYRANPHSFVDIADSALINSSLWGFGPASPGLTLNQGSLYEFFIATPASSGGGDD